MCLNSKLYKKRAFLPFHSVEKRKLDTKSRRVARRLENFCAAVLAAMHIPPRSAMGGVA